MATVRRRAGLADWGLALALAVATQLEFWTHSGGVRVRGLQAFGWLLVALLLAVRTRFPIAVLLAQVAVIDAIAAFVSPVDAMTAFAAILVATYTVAATVDMSRSLPVLGIAALGVGYHMSRDSVIRSQFQVVFELFVLFAVAGAGLAVRDRQRRLDLSDLRAESLQQAQEAAVKQTLARERAQIAREMHDVLAHNVSMMVLHAGAARQALDDRRPITREPLLAVETTGREALAELRRLLGLLRPDGGSNGLAPQPTLRDIDDLVERVRATGLRVTLRINGTPRRLPADLELSAFRIIQVSQTSSSTHTLAGRTSPSPTTIARSTSRSPTTAPQTRSRARATATD